MRRARRSTSWLLVWLGAAGLIAAACSGGGGGDAVAAPATPGPIVRVEASDLPAGFQPINFYHDIPGLLRDLSDPTLSGLGRRAAEPERSIGQGFANPETGELLFVITISMASTAAATAVLEYLAALPGAAVHQFISPDEQLFASDRIAGPNVGDGSLGHALRYGVEEEGQRTRDVVSDLLVFARRGTILFLLRSVSAGTEGATDPGSVDLIALGRLISDRIDAAPPERADLEADAAG